MKVVVLLVAMVAVVIAVARRRVVQCGGGGGWCSVAVAAGGAVRPVVAAGQGYLVLDASLHGGEHGHLQTFPRAQRRVD